MSMGGGAQQSNSSSFTNSQSFSEALGQTFGGSQSSGGTFVDPMQQPFRADLFGQAENFSNPAGAQRAAQGARRATAPYLSRALKQTGNMMDSRQQIDAQSASLQSGLGDLFRNEINPAIQTDAISAGGFGGGRQGVAEGVATGQLADAYTQGYGDIVANARNQSLQAANMMPGLAQARYQNAMQPYSAGLDNLSQYASILGAPTLLSRQGSTSYNNSLNRAISGSRAKGGSTSQSTGFEFGVKGL